MDRPLSILLKKHQKLFSAMPSPWVDGGAYKGEFIQDCHTLFPDKEIIAFEPIPHRARKLAKNYGAGPGKLTVHARVLGASKKNIKFHIRKGNPFSSVLPHTPLLRSIHGSRIQIEETIRVSQVRVDEILHTPPGVVKLDVQGSEKEALKGCTTFLQQIQGIVIELSQQERYKGQARADEIEAWLLSQGFLCHDKIVHPPQGHEENRVWDAFFINIKFLKGLHGQK
ncbi:MAG: FkbM family methyltransferase [Proteobacteria bacterium]|nr:FkbM family methyltransferase [Pseudomonadota bacterium]